MVEIIFMMIFFFLTILTIHFVLFSDSSEEKETTMTTATVYDLETKVTIVPSKYGPIEYNYCILYVNEKGSKKHSTYQFSVNSEVEAKVYCDAIERDQQYIFTHYDKDKTGITTAVDYELIEKSKTE
jgi:hypothetical protein